MVDADGVVGPLADPADDADLASGFGGVMGNSLFGK